MKQKLSPAQISQLRRIAKHAPSKNWPGAAYFDTRTEISLVRRGLIERFTHVSPPFDSRGPMAHIRVSWHMCRLTDAGRAVLNATPAAPPSTPRQEAAMSKLTNRPTMDWLRLTGPQERVLLRAWSNDSIVCSGRDLNIAHRLVRFDLLMFVRPIDGGLKGEFALTNTARDFPPSGLKALVIRPEERRAFGNLAGRIAIRD